MLGAALSPLGCAAATFRSRTHSAGLDFWLLPPSPPPLVVPMTPPIMPPVPASPAAAAAAVIGHGAAHVAVAAEATPTPVVDNGAAVGDRNQLIVEPSTSTSAIVEPP
jgi:hypothetical protein